MIPRFHKQVAVLPGLFFAIAVVIFSSASFIRAQTVEPAPAPDDGTGSVVPPPATAPVAIEPEVRPSNPAPTPVIIPGSSSSAATPVVTQPSVEQAVIAAPTDPGSTLPVVEATSVPEPTQESPGGSRGKIIAFIAAVIAALGIGGLLWKGRNKADQQDDQEDPCGKIKKQLDQKQGQLDQIAGQLSLQQVIVDELREKITDQGDKAQAKARDYLKDKLLQNHEVANKTVSYGIAAKETYDDLQEKYQQGKEVLETLRIKYKQLTGEVEALESAYQACLLRTVGTRQIGTLVEKAGLSGLPGKTNVFIFHGTEGYPEENWFPWLKSQLESSSHRVFVPQFPSPPGEPASVVAWFEVLKAHESYFNQGTVLIGHSLGGVFALRVLERLAHPVRAAFLVGTPVGVKPLFNYDRDNSFSGFVFDWLKIKANAKQFVVYQSDNDPYVSPGNGQLLAQELGVELSFVPNAGHFNSKAGYTEFPDLLHKVTKIL